MKTKLLIAIVFLSLLAACSEIGLADPHSGPEPLARAYLEAIKSQDCTKAESYWDPEFRYMVADRCKGDRYLFGAEYRCRIVGFQIDEILLDELAAGTVVRLYGTFNHQCTETGDEYTKDEVSIYVDDYGEKWYIWRSYE
jgi:hypothetical protein